MKIICDLNEDVTTYQYTEDEDGNRTDILDENGNKIIDNVKKKKNKPAKIKKKTVPKTYSRWVKILYVSKQSIFLQFILNKFIY